LCQPFIDKDIKEAFFSIPSIKCPNSSGFSSGFYKVTWPTINPLVCAAVKEFFYTGILPSHISETRLIILPKIPNPQRAIELRPISYCSIIY